MRRASLAALVAIAGCAGSGGVRKPPPGGAPPKVDPPPADPTQVVGIRRVYQVDFTRAWGAARSREDLLASTEEVVRKRIAGVVDGGVVRRTASGVEVFLPGDSPAVLETSRARVQRSGRFEVRLVDDGSAFMAALAGRVRAESPEGVTAEEDRWTGPGGRGEHRDTCLTAPDRQRLTAVLERLLVSQPLPPDREVLFEGYRSGWRTYYVVRGGGIDNGDVADASTQRSAFSGQPEVVVVLTADGRRKFAELTARSIGRKVVVAIDGTVQTAPMVMSAIPGGVVHILGYLEPPDDAAAAQRALEDLVAALRSGPLPAPLIFMSEDRWPPGRP